MATHSSVLAWRIPGTGEPHGLPSMGLHRVGHDWSDLAAAAAAVYICQCYFFNLTPHSSTLAWKTPWTEEPGRVQSMGSLRVGHGWATWLSLFTFMHWRRQWHPTPGLLPGKPHGQRSLVGCNPWGHKESDATKRLHFHFFKRAIAIPINLPATRWISSLWHSKYWAKIMSPPATAFCTN